MKVGIVTVHDSSNLGSFLQALGMQELVRAQGDDPYIVETRSHFTTFCLYMGYNNAPPVRSARSFWVFVLESLRYWRRTRQQYKKYRAYKRDWAQFQRMISAEKSRKLGLDAILLGSDEIWNTNQPTFQNPLLYGIGLEAKRKVAYAISCGNATAEKLCGYPHLKEGIKALDGVLVRDEHTGGVMQELGVNVAARTCDPTLQVDIRRYMRPSYRVQLPKGPYIAVYSYYVSEEMQNMITRFAKEHGLQTVAVSLVQGWCDQYVNCSPLEFGAVLEGADYVFTATFHGTIFSALYHKKFVVFTNLPKVLDVLRLLGLEERRLPQDTDYPQFCKQIKQEQNFCDMEERILKLREDSQTLYRQYVKGALENADL